MSAVDESTYDEMLAHYDILDQSHEDAKWEIFARARATCPVSRTDANGGFWLVTRYDDVRKVLEDWETFSSLESPMFPSGMRLCPIDSDPPQQTAARQLLNPLFSRTQLAPFEPRMRAIAAELIDKFIDQGTFELMGDFAAPFVSGVLAEVIFNDMEPDELAEARRIAHRVGHEPTPEAFADLFGMSQQYLAKVRANDQAKDGVVKTLITGTFDGRPTTEEEQLGMLGILILGGLDTTRGAITSIGYRVAETPGFEERLRQPSWIRRDLDEFLRLDSPVAAMARVATRDVELNGTLIRAGERVEVRYDSANRDETKFSAADQLVFDQQRAGHAAFGFGVHRCVGSNMARMQIEIAFEELLSRVRNLRIADGADIRWMPGNSNALATAQLDFDRIA